jgi:probable RNA-binding protein EIF1AD
MSKATKRKHVVREVEVEFVLPDEGEEIVKVIAGRGNNLHEVQDKNGYNFLVSMPSKFRRNVWIKRGDFVIVSTIEEGDKVKAEIVKILYKDQVEYIKKEGKWPSEFLQTPVTETENQLKTLSLSRPRQKSSSDESEDSDDDLFVNTNRRPACQYQSDTSSSSNDESNDEEEEA